MTEDPFDAFDPSDDWRRVRTLDTHTGGEPLRIVTDGVPELDGETILEKRRYMREELDNYRRMLIWEPRGHADMYGAIVTEPAAEEADFGVLFIHNEGYSTMCGHAIIALGTIAIETNVISGDFDDGKMTVETPAGLVRARAEVIDGRVESVEFTNVPSFVYERSVAVDVPEYGTIECDIAFGGAFYAYCDASQFDVDLSPDDVRTLIDIGQAVKAAVSNAVAIEHPTEDDLGFLYGTILTGAPHSEEADSRNVCIFADGEVDRCPTGTGVSGRVALRADNGSLAPGEEFTVESIVGSVFTGRYEEETTVDGYDAVYPLVRGTAHITGRHEFLVDPSDPFDEGFILR
jgi:proline racemase